MKTKTTRSGRIFKSTLVFGISNMLSISQLIADPFINLDFDGANTNNVVYDSRTGLGVGSVKDLLPGWQLFQDGKEIQQLTFAPLLSIANYPPPGVYPDPVFADEGIDYSVPIFLLGPPDPQMQLSFPDALGFPPGRFSIYAAPRGQTRFTLTQEGDVPDWASGLRITGVAVWDGGNLPMETIAINGTSIYYTNTFNGLDLSAFRGQHVQLAISFDGNGVGGRGHLAEDRYDFVPEPKVTTLFSLGFAILFARFAVHAKFLRNNRSL